jgi:ATP-dependent Zn protease
MTQSRLRVEPEWRVRLAYHEAGHAVMVWLMEQRTIMATIVPDEDCGGKVLCEMSDCDTVGDYYRDQLMIFIAGNAAELVFVDLPLEEYTRSDLWTAIRMLEAIAGLSRGSRAEPVWEELDYEEPPDFQTERYDALIDKYRAAFESAFEEAMDILYEERFAVHAVATALLRRGTLSGREISSIIDGVVWSQEA